MVFESSKSTIKYLERLLLSITKPIEKDDFLGKDGYTEIRCISELTKVEEVLKTIDKLKPVKIAKPIKIVKSKPNPVKETTPYYNNIPTLEELKISLEELKSEIIYYERIDSKYMNIHFHINCVDIFRDCFNDYRSECILDNGECIGVGIRSVSWNKTLEKCVASFRLLETPVKGMEEYNHIFDDLLSDIEEFVSVP